MLSAFVKCELRREDLFHKKLCKMLREGVRPEIDILFSGLSESDAINLEINLIRAYGRRDLKTGCLCNMTDGGDGIAMIPGPLGCIRSTNTRIKISRAGRKKFTAERKMALRKVRRRKSTPICSFNLITKEIVKVYPSQGAVTQNGYNPGAVNLVIRGLKTQMYELGWRYLTQQEIDSLIKKE